MKSNFKINMTMNNVSKELEKDSKSFDKAFEAINEAFEDISKSNQYNTIQDDFVTVIVKDGNIEIRGDIKSLKINSKNRKI